MLINSIDYYLTHQLSLFITHYFEQCINPLIILSSVLMIRKKTEFSIFASFS